MGYLNLLFCHARHNMFLIGLRFSGGRSMSGKATVETAVRTAVHDAISPAFICAFDTDVRTSTTAIIETAVVPANCLTSIQVSQILLLIILICK